MFTIKSQTEYIERIVALNASIHAVVRLSMKTSNHVYAMFIISNDKQAKIKQIISSSSKYIFEYGIPDDKNILDLLKNHHNATKDKRYVKTFELVNAMAGNTLNWHPKSRRTGTPGFRYLFVLGKIDPVSLHIQPLGSTSYDYAYPAKYNSIYERLEEYLAAADH
jgi:hypothetical protein